MTLYEIKNVFISLKKKQKSLNLLSKLWALMTFLSMMIGTFLLFQGSHSSSAYLLFFLSCFITPFVICRVTNNHLPLSELKSLNQEDNYLEFLNLSLFLMISNNEMNHKKLTDYESVKEKVNYNLTFQKKNMSELPQKIQDSLNTNKDEITRYFNVLLLDMYNQNIFDEQKIENILKINLPEKEGLIKTYLANLKEKAKVDEKKAIELEKSLGLVNQETQKALTLKL